jgi:membrane peptidoglycan carboxypeptidase
MAHRKIRLDKESREAIEQQLAAFRKKFGREPGPNDPIFFDPDADTPQPYPEEKFRREWNEVMDGAVRTGGIRPELAYAAKKTGFIVTESNKKKLTRQQLKEWDDAVQEYLDSVSKKVQ